MFALTLLVAQYHKMSNEELRLVKAKWQDARWNQSDDLLMFLSNFNDDVTFLVNHDYGPPRGEQQVTMMFEAIAHVPTLAAPTAPKQLSITHSQQWRIRPSKFSVSTSRLFIAPSTPVLPRLHTMR